MKREISSEDMEEITGIFRMILKEYDKRHGRMTEENVKPYVNAMEYW